MGITKQRLAKEILRAFALVIVGAVLIVSLKTSMNQGQTPYYAQAAQQRVESQAELNKQTGELAHDANSGTSSK